MVRPVRSALIGAAWFSGVVDACSGGPTEPEPQADAGVEVRAPAVAPCGPGASDPCRVWVPDDGDGDWLDRTEVSVVAWSACVAQGACDASDRTTTGGHGDDPAGGLSRTAAEAVCAWRGGHLPSGALWERAARGPGGHTYPWGEVARCVPTDPQLAQRVRAEVPRVLRLCADLVDAHARGDEGLVPPDHVLAAMCANPQGYAPEEVVETARVARGEPSLGAGTCTALGPSGVTSEDGVKHPWGLRWMAGNVWEWTSEGDATTGWYRGGSWMSTDPLDFRPTSRLSGPVDVGLPDVGARCAYDAPPPETP